MAAYYVHVSHKEVAVGGGVYMPEPDVLLAIRTHIAENHQKLRKILAVPRRPARRLANCRAINWRACPKASPPTIPQPTCCASRASFST